MAFISNNAHSAIKAVLDFAAARRMPASFWSAPADSIHDLRAAMNGIEFTPGAHDAWTRYCMQLRDAILNDDPSMFLRWKFIRRAMFLTNHLFLGRELAHLKGLPDWDSRWRPALREPQVGNPIPYLFAPAMAGNTIHLAYHVARWEAWSARNIGELECILEFGPGFGGMARLARALGFSGRYILYDLPQFNALQQFYLAGCALEDQYDLVNGISMLRAALTHEASDRHLFIANISLSETPMDVRTPIEELVRDWEHVLITYQSRFHDLDNRAYFQRWQRPGELWLNEAVDHIQDQWYLFVKRPSRPRA